MTEKNATITSSAGTSAELPVLSGTHGPDCVDVRGMNKSTGLFTYDPGFATYCCIAATL